ncbi:bifunctional 5,10-methylenetetrahydrofolate dehydrogenase/5,10-methenyltetrahydrofolate cyclohydrolase [Geomonas sp. Red32]|uniref:bifunctional 5,10-methylenetetrahydrofolate dehydrogenase/5,10-methenyltetrahydrofolate cyclohydrolase n=1 Tax=Geomonas sp. Red32 TaxID=2912856 RepID=UPI00202CD35B|nr:bifunctional 5,10-methylenetetrahydrofolate dehydrogenase/5,10-methenyltetrahydrofolate cyclohydrolase [Geomonas sp. Red32]MCM0082664.1 bifunctional 5,10-methylenetetrahydrofolate dehydrogenase/5,10-methenyltetrahydrofolate cyclohydrolase [Geomonas sp. Red32]
MKLLDGKLCAESLVADISRQVAVHVAAGLRKPHMTVILVGNHAPSESYVKSKITTCSLSGFDSSLVRFPETVYEQELLAKIEEINLDPSTDGVIVQLPLPAHIDQQKVINSISPDKDIDGFHPTNFGRMALGQKAFRPATAYGICKLLQFYQVPVVGKHCVVIGRSNIVGKPISIMLSNDFDIGNATVTLTHIETPRELLLDETRRADIVIVAVGIPGFVTPDMVKEGVTLIDVGINRLESGKIVGDVAFDAVAPKCAWITPVPGGVGRMTVAALMINTLIAYQNNFNLV